VLFEFIDVRLIALVCAFLIWLAVELGFAYGHRRAESLADDAPLGATLAAAFGVVALLLGFSFQIAVNRYDVRRESVVEEANAIGTTILRTRLFDEVTGARMRATLHDYVDARIEFSRAGVDVSGRAAAAARTALLQRDLWRQAMSAVARNPHSTLYPLFVQTLNNMIDVSSQQAEVLSAVIPQPILWVLLAVILVAAMLLGIEFGRKGRRANLVTALFAIMLALVIGIIVDLDLPQRGLIRIDLTPLHNLYSLF
jgi:hypothetical protein